MEKKYLIPLVTFVVVGIVAAVAVASGFFAHNDITLTVTEARSADNVSLTFTGVSGNTYSQDITINNAASVALCARLNWQQIENVNGVTYTTDLPKNVILSVGANTVPISFTFDQITESGSVTGVANYEKVACA